MTNDIFGDPIQEESVETTEKKPKSVSPFDWIKFIQTGKPTKQLASYLDNCQTIVNEQNFNCQGYVPFIVNRGLALHPDTLLSAVEINMFSHLDIDMQFAFLKADISKKSRKYIPWPKEDKIQDIESVQKLYNCNHSKAMQILNLVTNEELKLIEKTVSELVQNNMLN